jgi:hypothetical protein
MSLHHDLLEQAKHLATRDRGRPRQASLRRAISTAYYALFHLLVDEATRMVASDQGLRPFVSRTFDHGEMKQASQAFEAAGLPRDVAAIAGAIVPADLRFVVGAFLELQLERHEADYKIDRSFTRREVLKRVEQVDEAFQKVGQNPEAADRQGLPGLLAPLEEAALIEGRAKERSRTPDIPGS